MLLKIPFAYTRTLRNQLQKLIPFKLRINQALRNYAKNNTKSKVTIDELVNFLLDHRRCKNLVIPAHMKYNLHVREYWKSTSNPTFTDCIAKWYARKNTLGVTNVCS